MFSKNHWVVRFIVFAFFGFTLVNLMFLNYLVLKDRQNIGEIQIIGSAEHIKDEAVCDTKTCVPALYNAITQATGSSKTITHDTQSGIQEYTIALGTGTTVASDWTNAGGAEAYIDSQAYGTIEKVTFEASAFIPTGNQIASIRLYNATAKHPVWFSEVTLQGGEPQFLISSPITLDPGNNLYQVQMKTQLQYPVVLSQSRVHIVSKK